MAESCEQRGVCGIQNVVEADGSVYPCDFYMMDEYRLGNFNTDRLDDINQRRSEIQFIEQSWKLDEECRFCKYFRLCRGGCQRNRDFQPAQQGALFGFTGCFGFWIRTNYYAERTTLFQ